MFDSIVQIYTRCECVILLLGERDTPYHREWLQLAGTPLKYADSEIVLIHTSWSTSTSTWGEQYQDTIQRGPGMVFEYHSLWVWYQDTIKEGPGMGSGYCMRGSLYSI